MFLCVLSPLNPCVSPPVYSHVCPSVRSLIAHLFSFACLSLRPPALPSSGLPFFRQPVWRLFFICSVLWSVIAVLAGGEASMDCEGNCGRRSRTCGRVFARLMSLQCLLLSGGECPQRTRVSLFRTDGRTGGRPEGRTDANRGPDKTRNRIKGLAAPGNPKKVTLGNCLSGESLRT